MSGAMNFYTRDVYGDYGIDETSTVVQPDPEDQSALVDDQEAAQNTNTDSTPSKTKVLGAVGLIFGVAVILSFLSK